MEIRGKHGIMTNSEIAMAILGACSDITSELSDSGMFQDLKNVAKEADVENKTNQDNNSNLLVSNPDNTNINLGQNNLTDSQMQDKNIDNVQSENNCSWFDIVMSILAVVGLFILTIITLGAIFWWPALFNCCRNNNISIGIENKQSVKNSPAPSDIKSKNPENQIPAQSGNNNIKENLNNRGKGIQP